MIPLIIRFGPVNDRTNAIIDNAYTAHRRRFHDDLFPYFFFPFKKPRGITRSLANIQNKRK